MFAMLILSNAKVKHVLVKPSYSLIFLPKISSSELLTLSITKKSFLERRRNFQDYHMIAMTEVATPFIALDLNSGKYFFGKS